MNERFKMVRKALKLSQEEFGKRLGLTRGAITNIELNKTEPKPLFVSLVCKEFDVNEEWLRTGDGEMFIKKTRDQEIAEFLGDVLRGDETFKRKFVSALARMNEDQWDLLANMIFALAKECENQPNK